jgi:GNAT superfamily N-acetyltransferase
MTAHIRLPRALFSAGLIFSLARSRVFDVAYFEVALMLATNCHIALLHPLQPSLLEAHLRRLSPVHRADRFGSLVCDDFLKDYANRSVDMGTVVIGCLCDENLRAVVEIRPFDPVVPINAEAAFSVEEPFQGQGVGTALMSHAISAAPSLGIRKLIVCCASRNMRMRRIAQRYGANVVDDQCDYIAAIAVEAAGATG